MSDILKFYFTNVINVQGSALGVLWRWFQLDVQANAEVVTQMGQHNLQIVHFA